MATTAEAAKTSLIGSGLPPSPRGSRVYQTAAWVMRPYGFLARSHAELGDRFTIRIGQDTIVILAHPDDVKQVFTGDPDLFHAGKGNNILLPLMGRQSVLLLDGKEHMNQRKLLLPPFHGEKMRGHLDLMRQIAEREVAGWPTGVSFELAPRMQALTLEVILRIVFGVDEGSPLLADLRREMKALLDAVVDPRRGLKIARYGAERVHERRLFADILDPVDQLVFKVIAEHRALPDLERRDDVLSLLLRAQHDDGSPMSDSELRDELMTLLIAGHETTATALTWAIERLTRHPAQMAALTRSLTDGDTDYVDAVIKETLRLRPVLPIVARELQDDAVIGNWRYKKGTLLALSITLVHRRPDLYPDPLAFRPERWLGERPNPYHWFPFGGGIRRCVGAAFAETEMRVVLDAIVRSVELTAPDPAPERVRRRAITLVPSRKGTVVARPVR